MEDNSGTVEVYRVESHYEVHKKLKDGAVLKHTHIKTLQQAENKAEDIALLV
jgi:hypothetical protein